MIRGYQLSASSGQTPHNPNGPRSSLTAPSATSLSEPHVHKRAGLGLPTKTITHHQLFRPSA